ncbi:methyl-accepting chemotaxis sensory transducer with phytochrome sensor [Rivularia sp. IAM M-261]|nr:methyl-accepting chemotaxis sensory transducer with phytochrome sensor [Calothrix sp. PCC 7716]GJD16412.1 methyl-accepting chemotaxis sensory transducer with phytochrome sensor [Rivularia sp. IAM M-261]
MSSVYQENGHYSTEEKTENNNLENMAPVASSQDVMELANSKNNSNTDSPEQQFKVWRQMFARIASSIHKAGDINTLTSTLAQEIREKLETDRVFVYRFTNEDSGVVIAESRSNKWTPARNETLPAVLFGLETNTEYLEPVIIQVQNNLVELSAYQTQLLDKYQVKSSLSLPIILEGNVWGLLVVHSCGIARTWQESEITLLSQLCAECKSKIVSFEYQKQLQRQEEEHQSFVKVIDKIQRASSLDRIFQATTQEIRQMLQCDRVAVYRFNPDWSGEFVAESVAGGWMRLVGNDIKTVWEDTHLQETQGGRYKRHENLIANDIYKMGHSPCHVEILEQFEIKAYATVPVFAGNKLWGLLAAYQNSNTREWQEWEVKLLNQFAANFGVAVLQVETLQQTQEQSKQLARTAERQQSLIALTRKIGEALTATVTDTSLFDSILQTTVAEVRRLLEADRTVVYRFNPDWSGEFIAESIAKGWIPFKNKEEINQALLKENGHCDSIRNLADVYKNKDTYLQDSKGGRYQQKTTFVVDDVKEAGFPPCYMELLEQFEAKAYLTVPIFKENKLWAFLATYQHSAPRKWEAFEVTMMEQVAALLGAAMQQAETFEKLQRQSQKAQKLAALDSSATSIIDKIRQSLDVDFIFSTVTKEIRSLLNADRVVVYQFKPDWSGEFVAESVSGNWVRLVGPNGGQIWADTYLQETQGGRYRNREYFVANDMYAMGHADCHIQILEQYQARAYVIVPIFQGDTLWGLLAAYQNSGTREWEETEVNLLVRVSDQLGVALQQVEYLHQLQQKNQEIEKAAKRDRDAANVIDKIRQSMDMQSIFNIATKEVRALLKTDRVTVYRFNPDWSGLFVAESVGDGWVSLLEKQNKIPRLQESISSCYNIRTLFATSEASVDTYLRATEGGELRNRRAYVRPDIHNAGFPSCYTEVLDEYQVKSYAIVPIFQGSKLWGMLAAFENSGTREWEESEISLLSRIGDQLGIALQQTEYLEQLQSQSTRVAQAVEREKEAKEYLQKGAMQLLSAVRPALNGDLTVRAPISEDELGTIADAYNNTLQALRQIVVQVQGAAQQVASTSSQSSASLSGLTHLAQQQSKELNEALGEIQQMVDSTQAVVGNAELVQLAVQQANQTVESGDEAMNLTVEAIQGIRETVSQTSKKIKRLSESSQKISKVVNLISNFATQTNVLALNAAIEATRAGEYGKGFAVVADEVRSLSRQSAAATIEIEKLVQEIQEETGEVAVAMETGIQQVVEGTNLVNQTRLSLNAIVVATAEISQLLQQITDATQGQMLQSVSVTASMKDVAKIANKTSAEASNITTVFNQLSEMAQELLSSASKFKVH